MVWMTDYPVSTSRHSVSQSHEELLYVRIRDTIYFRVSVFAMIPEFAGFSMLMYISEFFGN